MDCNVEFPCKSTVTGHSQQRAVPAHTSISCLNTIRIPLHAPRIQASRLNLRALVCLWLALGGAVAHGADGSELKPALSHPAMAGTPTVEAPVFAEADRISGRVEEEVTLRGDARLSKAGSAISADMIRYTQLEDEVFAVGNVRISRDGDVFTGPELRLKMDIRTGYFLEPVFTRRGGEGRGNAARVDFLGPERTFLTESIYTTCAPGNLDWFISTATLMLDESSQTGDGRNAVVFFKGVPIIASPWITFPLSDERKSGFLPPTFSLTSRSGAEFMLPYYWDIAPNRDLTVYPKYIGLRGIQLGGNFRYLEPSFKGEARAEFLPGDNQTGRDRYSLAAVHSWGSGPWSGSWNLNRVSDDNYFVDFSRTIAAASQRTLPRDGILNYSGGNGFWSVTGRLLSYQTLQDPLNPIARPYEKLPQIALHAARRDQRGFDFVLNTDATRFAHESQVQGTRMVVNPSASYPYLAPGYFITPKVSLHATQYDLTRVAPGNPARLTRILPIASLDAGLIFERDTDIFGQSLRQTLEPRLFYVRTPFRDQSQYPNFDSGLVSFSFVQMFSENPFGGSDRIADSNQITAALVSRYLDAESGAERLRLAIGQRFYLSPQRVTLPGGAPIDQKSSDFLATLTAEVLPKITIEGVLQYSQTVDNVMRATAGIQWRPETGKVLNVGYRYLRDSLNQGDISGQWPLGGRWHGVGRLNYSVVNKRLIETLGGLEYDACCWKLRLVAQCFATATASATTTLFVQLELKGFSRIGSNPTEAIRRNIPGYEELGSVRPQGPFPNQAPGYQ